MTARVTARVTALAGALAVAGPWACRDAPPSSSAPVAALTLSDTAVVLRLGDETALAARAERAGGEEIVGRRVFWSSQNPALVEVSQAGVLRGLALGSTSVAASLEGRSAVARVTVLARPVAAVQIDPPTLQLVVGARQRLAARTFDDVGTPTAAAVAWTTLSPDVVAVNADGDVTALAPGAGSVRATAEGASATAAVVVTPVPVAAVVITPADPSLVAGATIQLAAATRDAAGNPLAGRDVAWSSRDPGVAVVSSTGQVTGIAPGTATVVATAEGRSATVTVTVRPVPVARVVLTPDGGSIGVGGTVRLAAVPTDAAGNALTGRAVAFASSASGVARVAADGVVTGVAAGTATITATSEGVSASTTVRVVASSAVASVAVAPATATLTTGQTRTFTATARAADGTTVTGRPVTWSSGAPSVVTVSSTGTVTAVAPGTAQVLAQVDGITGTATVTVQRVPVASVQVAPATATVAAGAFAQLAATPRDASGAALAGRVVAWSSANEGVATVTSDGRVFGVAPGATTVRATSEGVTGSAAVTVTAVVRVSPATASLRTRVSSASSVLLVATDHAGRIIPGTEVTWRSSNTDAATVNALGIVTARWTGSGSATAVVTASARGASGSATITVTRN